ncbi:hypothetical protein [Ornithobacterium rhinotracheale]|uniref:hypothetical protein n=1 Tax=Ornithobacterium rhinotracheale TaxID=28251 RepID=UPI001FF1CB97|nr:hypothetical protein [Ornithobacterium rhinotracheale]MCK0201341.1 hypothetical protein [Ornithobacterium rhinotracheale]
MCRFCEEEKGSRVEIVTKLDDKGNIIGEEIFSRNTDKLIVFTDGLFDGVYIEDGELVGWLENADLDPSYSYSTKINYCPMCGRELNKGNKK